MPDVKMQKTMRIPTIRISSLFFLLLLTTAFSTPLFAQDAAPTDPAALVLPEDQAMIIDTTTAVVLEWSAVDRAATYEAQVFLTEPVDGLEPIPLKTKVLSPTSQELLVADLLDALALPQADGDSTYHWRVRARNSSGEGPWSEVWEFTLVPLVDAQPPEWLALPTDGTPIDELTTYAFTVNAESMPVSPITYTLDQASIDAGMMVDPATGAFTWMPSESQGADAYSVTFTATTDDGRTRDSTITFQVAEVNLAPALDAIGDQAGSVDTPITFTATASDPDTLAPPPFTFNTLTYTLDQASIDAGMTIDPVTGEFSWTSATAGTFPVTVTVTDDGVAPMSASETFNIVISENPPPDWLALPTDGTPIDELTTYEFTVEAQSMPASPITYTLDQASIDAGMMVDPATGAFIWMPTESQGADAYSVTFTATTDDGRTRDSTITFQVQEVNLAPVLDTIGDQSGSVNEPVTFTATATDPDTLAPPPFTFNTLTYTLDQASIDAGMTIDPVTGEFSWTSATAGTFPVTVTVTDDGVAPMSASETFNIVISDNPPPEWLALPADDTPIDELTTYEFTVEAESMPPSAITYTLDQASIDAGMMVDPATGAFIWMPSESQGADSYSVTFTATTAEGLSRDSTVTFLVAEVNLMPVLDAIGDQTVMENTAVAFTATASDPDTLAPPPFTFNTLTFTLDQASIDAGMTIDPVTGEFAWTSGAAGTFPVTVTVTDDGVAPMSASETFNIIVTSDPPPPPPPPTSLASFCAIENIGTFRWTNPVDSQGNQVAADSFFVEVSRDRSFGQAPLIVAKTGTDTPDISGSEALFATTLDVLEIGPIHYWRVRAKVGDVEGNASEPVPFRRWPAQVMVQNTLPFASANKSQDFRMISLPGAQTVEIGSTFSGTQAPNGPLTAGGNWDWSVWEDNKQETTYPNYVANPMLAADMFEPGVGYWAISTSAWTVPSTQVNTVTIVDEVFYPIPLNQAPQSMWTMIGNPFDFPVAWQDILGANPDITGDDQLWDWTGQRYEAVTVLQPYKGYYFFNRDNREQLNMPCYLEPATGKVAAREEQHIAALELSLHEDRDGLTPALSDVTLKWHEEAEPGMDRFDHYVPPAQFESFRVSLVNEDLETDYAYLSQEARPSLDEAQSFKLELKSIPNEPTYLRIAGLEDLANQEVYLFDEALGQSFDLHENPVVLLEPGQEISGLRLLVGDAAYISAEKSKLLPEGFKMQQSYPNPFVEQTTIEYALPSAEFVTIEVYNVLGQRVRTLVRDEQDAGYHRVSWNGLSDSGDEVASGMYLYVFTSPSHRATERLVRVR